MTTLFGMPQGAEWLIILAIVVLLFGSAKLPALVRQVGKSKKIWEEEVGPGRKKDDELAEASAQAAEVPAPVQHTTQPNGEGLPSTHAAN
ncbi:twin-arginine translocase TatA/TatE family subunit [Kribbella catacumbae]|uniref:twin-arginine translocase TatA/TatE family subunit n=1 Tax=Kribbella catacumbae TaxID=460086 RepID=UPI000372309C|nr:twin-arginine translocase TatA/TatE family subunit [Kribbella catacumbae]